MAEEERGSEAEAQTHRHSGPSLYLTFSLRLPNFQERRNIRLPAKLGAGIQSGIARHIVPSSFFEGLAWEGAGPLSFLFIKLFVGLQLCK